MLNFRLVYQGLLVSSGNKSHSPEKHAIRRYLHRQLMNAWKLKEPLKARSGILRPFDPEHRSVVGGLRVVSAGAGTDRDEQIITVNSKKYLPIVSEDLALTCTLDILLLSSTYMGVMKAGDLDGRIKTIVDALRIPQHNECSEGDEDPLYVLMEDDELISGLTVTADLLLADPEQVIKDPRNIFGEIVEKPNHVLALIDVAIRPTEIIRGNLDFV